MNRLNLEALHPNWIRAQSAVQIKVSSDKMECSWKDYYAVLTTFGFVLTYKESLSNYSSKRSSSLKSIHLFGAIDLRSFEITPATKADTRKKFSLLLKDPLERLTVFISMPNESLYSEWSDSFMREKIAVQEERQSKEPDLVQISGSMPLYSKLLETRKQTVPRSSLEHNEGHENAKPGSSLSRWLSRSNKNNTKSQANSTATDASTVGEVFGGPLKLEKDGNVPLVVRLCIEQVEARGLDTVGIYRLSGQTTAIQKYKAQFNSCHEKIKLDQENDINVITGLLKLYFRELKNPLLTFENYDRLIEAARLQDYDERMFRLKSIIQILPLANYRVLKYLIKHLETVSLQSQVNKMEASNLALIFSMGLLRPKNDDISASVLQSDLASKVIECMITHAAWFFDHEVEDDEDSQSFNNHSQVI
ncbi:Rho GTPase activation protein [Blakeslea trispora]|nr:Rho GTPase activation protein [Blakeslea trispora]